jgi:colanic acid/amylovoran biosynthesis glycosyltransferase
MMRTAAIVYEYPSVSQTFVRGQIEGLIDLGCDVRIFAEYDDRIARAHASARSEQHRVKYFGFPLRRFRESVGRMRGKMSSGREKSGGRDFSDSSVSTARLRFESRTFRGERPFDVIHAHFGPNGVRAVRLRDRGLIQGPIITSFYGYDVGRRWTCEGYGQLFEKGDLFTALSEEMRRRLIAMGCPADRLVIHPLGVDIEKFSPRPRVAGKQMEILTVARLVPKKGVEFGLRAVAALIERGVAARYTIVGHGELRAQLERTARSLGIGDSVKFAGPQPQSAIAELLHETDVLLAPSVTAADGDAEGTPVVILEAQAMGVPVVSTMHAGTPEIVGEGKSGFLVAEGDVAALTERLALLRESPAMRAGMGSSGRAIVVGNHDIRILNRKLLGIYERLGAG